MFDPLASTNSIFGGDDSTPPWPTTPHPPRSPVPNLRQASPGLPAVPDKGPSAGLYGKEPQIYGQPEPGLISPGVTVSSNGSKLEKPEPYLRVRITGLDRNRRDVLVKLDAQTNLSNFTGTAYRNISRSYLEFQQFYEAIVHNNPQTIVPALPLAQTSAPTDEEDDRLVRIMLQRWITRVCEDLIILADEDLRAFIESDFGYQPTPRQRKRTSSGFGIMRRSVPDEDEDLQRARFELTKLEGQFFETAKAIDRLAVARKALSVSHAEMGSKLVSIATTEAHPPLATAMRKLGRTWHSLADLDQAQATTECVVIGDSLGYQGINARSAKETLLQRTGVLEEYQAAVKTTISKRRHIERLKASSNIRPDRVDDALEDMEEASKYEQTLAKRAEGISQNLHKALKTYNGFANDDITAALIEHARSSIMYERQLLRELEALRSDISDAAKKVVATNDVPRPSVVPPLEDYSAPPPPPESRKPLHTPSQAEVPPQSPRQSIHTHAAAPRTQPLPPLPKSSSAVPGPSSMVPALPSAILRSPAVTSEPPLGGRFVEGSKSMFVKPSPSRASRASPLSPTFPTNASQSHSQRPLRSSAPGPTSPPPARTAIDPLLGTPIGSPSGGPSNGVGPDPALPAAKVGFVGQPDPLDPLAHSRPGAFMSSSVRVQPTRSRLDAREAASKLANMF